MSTAIRMHCRNGHRRIPENLNSRGACKQCIELAKRRFRLKVKLGQPINSQRTPQTFEATVAKHSERHESGCRLWKSAMTGKDGHGCPTCKVNNKSINVRRKLYEQHIGPLATDDLVYTRCRNDRCIELACFYVIKRGSPEHVNPSIAAASVAAAARRAAPTDPHWMVREAQPHRRHASWIARRFHLDADDVWQTVMVKLLAPVERPDDFRAWFCHTVRNTCIDMIRARKAYSESVRVVDDIGKFDVPAGKAWEPEYLIEDRDEITIWLRRIDRLPPRQRHIMRALIEGFSQEQLATRFHITDNTVEQHLHKARTRLREMVERNSRWKVA